MKKVCKCGNPKYGFPCVCDHIAENIGNISFSCEYCGLYTASKPRCGKCEIMDANDEEREVSELVTSYSTSLSEGVTLTDASIDMPKGTMSKDRMEAVLYEVCDAIHASCDSYCPVYALNGGKVPMNDEEDNCQCFKNGAAMLRFIRQKISPIG